MNVLLKRVRILLKSICNDLKTVSFAMWYFFFCGNY